MDCHRSVACSASYRLGNNAIGNRVGRVTYLGSHGLVDGSPPDVVFRRVLLDNSLVEGRAASLGAGVGSQSTAVGDGGTSLVDLLCRVSFALPIICKPRPGSQRRIAGYTYEGIFVESGNGGVVDLKPVC